MSFISKMKQRQDIVVEELPLEDMQPENGNNSMNAAAEIKKLLGSLGKKTEEPVNPEINAPVISDPPPQFIPEPENPEETTVAPEELGGPISRRLTRKKSPPMSMLSNGKGTKTSNLKTR